MSQTKTPEKKQSRLSLSKSRKGLALKVTSSPLKSPASPSIAALFKNAPPPKVSCPLCGQMVPRFGLNNHIDETCPKAKEENDDVILVGDINPKLAISTCTSPQLPLNPKTSITKTKVKTDPAIPVQVNNEQASPYFGTHVSVRKPPKDVEVVTTVPLGSLSSKLSRRNRLRKAKQNADGDMLHGSVDSNDCNETSTNETSDLQVQEDTRGSEKATASSSPDSMKNTHEMNNKQKCHETTGGWVECPSSSAEVVSSEQLDCVTDKKIDPLKRKRGDDFKNKSKKRKGSNSLETKEDLNDKNQGCGDHPGVSSMEDNNDILPVEDLGVLEEFLKPFNETESNVEAGDGGVKEPVSDPSIHPYYLRNFLMVLQTVMENEEDMSLFSEEDTRALTTFCQLSAGGQKLYVRLFQRKLNWIKVSKIEYTEIGSDLTPFIEELSQHGFLQTDSDLEELSEALDLLSAPELKNLAKTFHLANPNVQKHQLVEEFLRLSRQRSIFSKNQSGVGAAILRKAKDSTGRAVRVCKGPRAVFSRVLLLFSLTESTEVEEAASGGQTLLSTVLMVNMGRMTFPHYTVQRSTRIFLDREDLISYECAMHKLVDIVVTMTNGKWKEAHLMFQRAQEDWDQLKNGPNLRYHTELPLYLRCFTVGWLYTRILSRGVEILQRLHQYEEAVQLLQTLLSQNIYCPDSRGRWWDRLALNLHQHLKLTQKAVTVILEGLSDPYVRTGHKLSLYQRAVKIRDSPSCKKFHSMFNELPEIKVDDVPHVTIKGKMYPQTGMGKSVFLMENLVEEDGEEIALSTVMCSVEELALAHYRELGFDQGIHGEGSTFSTLYGLFMWDIVFMEGVPDVFRNSYQAFPLDLHTDSFYENRKDAIESRLQLLQDSPIEVLHDMMADVWGAHLEESAALVSWERFSSLQQAQGLVSCLGGPVLSEICRKMCKDIRHCRGGLPDLVVWNVQKKVFKLVEVKGPSDRLSHKQMVWLHELKKMGADVEVCHVVAIGAKSNRLN
ncbi:fanconi-associated nuclease 1 [Bufo gargarizans]|uniref:fanconi-associated nuclease 1 n=1 Tax=Bufo gargarizans TaxID=30331 RepID=UPI001CF50E2D|nr:fanconi-associated nuclease 1 [Bufo gargarizans]XP_044135676.1 fanconi-associated nuclease 1 [Bufo gargarizans]